MPSVATKTARADITEQFFTAGELMELTGDIDDGLEQEVFVKPDAAGLRGWLALAAASAVGLLVLVVLSI